MKMIGMIGGLGPESTIDYYRRLLEAYARRYPGQGALPIVINSLDVKKGLAMVEANRLKELSDYLLEGMERLARAGATCGLISANTPHLVFDEVAARSPIPLVSIVEATCAEARRQKAGKVTSPGWSRQRLPSLSIALSVSSASSCSSSR